MLPNNRKQGGFFAFILVFALCLSFIFTAVAQAACPICGSEGTCNLVVKNYQGRPERISGPQKVNIIRVVMPGKTSKDWSNLKYSVNSFMNFCNTASYGKIQFTLGVAVDFNEPVCRYNEAQSLVTPFSDSLPEALVTVIFFPTGVAGFSHAGGGRCMMAGNLIRDVIHEAGHVLGLAHSNALQSDGTVKGSADPSSYMSSLASCQNYAINQQHWLGWTRPFEAVRINDCLSKVDHIDVPLRPIGPGGNGLNSTIPLSYVYDIPGGNMRIWISIPKGSSTSTKGMQGGEIFVYSADNCKGKTGMCSGDTVIKRIADPTISKDYAVNGLIINPISYQGTVSGTTRNISQVTIRIKLAATPPPVGNPVIADWEFLEEAGTTLKNTINDGLTSPATWNTDRAGVTTTGDDNLKFSPTTNTIDGSCSYLDLAGDSNAITTGKVWSVMAITGFNFKGTAGERLHLGLTNALSNSPTGEFILRRVADNSIHLMGFAGGTLPATGVQIYNSNVFDGLLEIMTEYDFGARTYQVFYRFDGSGQWTSIGAASALASGNMGNAFRLAAGDTATAGTGSWADSGEYLNIGSIYLTKADPRNANQAPSVSVIEPNDGDNFDVNSNITLKALAEDSDGNVTKVEFYNGETLLGQVATPPVLKDIALLAINAQIHNLDGNPPTAKYESSHQNIGYWTNVKDWVSWNTTITKATTFEVWINFACVNTSAGATYRVEVGDKFVNGTVTGTGTGWTTYETVNLGRVDLQAGSIAVNVKPQTKPGSAVMNLSNVTLKPIDSNETFVYEYVWPNVASGTYTITAKATDDDNEIGESEPVTVTVKNREGDVDGDGVINGIDLKIMTENWLDDNGRTRKVGQLIGQWDFAECSGTSAADVSGNGNTLTVPSQCWSNGAISLNGTNTNYLYTENNPDKLQLTDSYTIALKLNAAATQSDTAGIIAKCSSQTPIPMNHWSIAFGSGTTSGKILAYNGMTSWDTGLTLAQIAGSWHHLAIVYGGNAINSYLDGNLVKSSEFTTLPGNGDGHLNIGCERQKVKFFNGQIDDIVILNYELLADEVSILAADSTFAPADRVICLEKPLGDLNEDCRVDYRDYAEVAANWLK